MGPKVYFPVLKGMNLPQGRYLLKQIMLTSVAAAGSASSSAVASGKVQVVQTVRAVNTHATASTDLKISAGPTGGMMQVSPKLTLAAGNAYLDETEFILKENDFVKVEVTGGGPVQVIVSGFERDIV